ncbi:ThiF family adenylyltransferase [Geodermatophilus marinus]|uniref:ThiF family adenylyltransferase n=1 Tax=Geodermatophilus sp. LHW52908 TaxID=2303986 RepID=UPI000E3E3040|nr:ThiF family adenylyltransferase [Geodermatophilus sp. LHW52908]RFU22487.1 ThiF family adenylyltransferase [Geodermatophilus sp. LHW52908]
MTPQATDLYDELTCRNRGFLPPETQGRLRAATVLVAGCGSTGGAAVEPLVRLGVQDFVLADNGTYELNNLNRQSAAQADVGAYKAEVCARHVAEVNPHARTRVDTDGIRPGTVRGMVAACDVVIDGVDVTEAAGWRAKYALHEAAAELGRPVISGYDMAGTQYVRFYDYRRTSAPFDGAVTREQVEAGATWRLLRQAVPLRVVPVEMLESARRAVASGDGSVSQLVYTSMLFGALASRMVVDVLDGRPVRRHTVVDVHRAVRPPASALRARLRKPWVAALALRDLAVLERGPGRRR